ncbi:MAG: sulfite exporter TauE/SafE family protein, partial [Planctomycetales bacterium]|nr:sulfite exporter TauE/SafE family protein [Planctomycetales bacterium]
GVLSGMFGVGGGFVIVPALVLFSGMEMHHAVATSLLVIFLVSISGVGFYIFSGGSLSLVVTALFILGGFIGMNLGSNVSKKLSGPNLQRVFASAIIAVAIFVITRQL